MSMYNEATTFAPDHATGLTFIALHENNPTPQEYEVIGWLTGQSSGRTVPAARERGSTDVLALWDTEEIATHPQCVAHALCDSDEQNRTEWNRLADLGMRMHCGETFAESYMREHPSYIGPNPREQLAQMKARQAEREERAGELVKWLVTNFRCDPSSPTKSRVSPDDVWHLWRAAVEHGEITGPEASMSRRAFGNRMGKLCGPTKRKQRRAGDAVMTYYKSGLVRDGRHAS